MARSMALPEPLPIPNDPDHLADEEQRALEDYQMALEAEDPDANALPDDNLNTAIFVRLDAEAAALCRQLGVSLDADDERPNPELTELGRWLAPYVPAEFPLSLMLRSGPTLTCCRACPAGVRARMRTAPSQSEPSNIAARYR